MFLPRFAIDVCYARGLAVGINQDVLDHGIRSQFQVPASLSYWKQKPRRGEEGTNFTAKRTVSTIMARGMPLMRFGELRDSIR